MAMMKGKKALVDLLQHEGVEYVFGIPGATEVLFMDAVEKAPDIRYILGLHEVVCAGCEKTTEDANVKIRPRCRVDIDKLGPAKIATVFRADQSRDVARMPAECKHHPHKPANKRRSQ